MGKNKRSSISSINEIARKSNWIIIKNSEVFEKVISKNSGIYILKDGSKWCVWRGYWILGIIRPIKEKVIIENVSFYVAIRRANNYLNWLNSKGDYVNVEK